MNTDCERPHTMDDQLINFRQFFLYKPQIYPSWNVFTQHCVCNSDKENISLKCKIPGCIDSAKQKLFPKESIHLDGLNITPSLIQIKY